jgi:hypothetical protein
MRVLTRSDSGESQLHRELRRALQEIGSSEVRRSSNMEELAGKVMRHMQLRVGDYTLQPDFETIGRGLLDVLGIRPFETGSDR